MDNLRFIRVRQVDPNYGSKLCDAIVNVSMIVRIIPRWYESGPTGSKHPMYVDIPGPELLEKGIQKDYLFYDATGQEFYTSVCDKETRDFIEKIWIRFGFPSEQQT